MTDEQIRKIISDIVLISNGIPVNYKTHFDFTQQENGDPVSFCYDYLFAEDNHFRELNRYLQMSEDFFRFQTAPELIPGYWLLFTIIDPSDDEQPIKYLYGPSRSSDVIKPSFLFRSVYSTTHDFKTEKPQKMHELGTVANLIRHRSEVKAATQDLESLRDQVVYVPSAEIDYHILWWCMDYLKETGTVDFSVPFRFFPKERYLELRVEDAFIESFKDLAKRTFSLKNWLAAWGLAVSGTDYCWSSRGMDLLALLEIPASDFDSEVKALVAAIQLEKKFINTAHSFQTEIHYLARFRRNILTPRGIMRFSDPEFKDRNGNYAIYLNIVVQEILGPGLRITAENLGNEHHEVCKRFRRMQPVFKLLTAIEFKRIYIDQLIPKYEERILQNTLRAAISQLLNRNGSHNIGSHVLSRLVLAGSIRQLKDELTKPENKNHQYQYLAFLAQNNREADKVHSEDFIAYLMSYLKTRMDFLADIATSTPTLESSKYFLRDVIAGFDQNRILLNRISGSNNFKYRLQIKDCRECTAGNKQCNCPELTVHNDVLVSIVNDVLGHHAFYVILENIIRNTAKHAIIPSGMEVVFTIGIKECAFDRSFYEIVIFDNCDIPEPRLSELVTEQNRRLNESILEDNQLRHGNWGLIEMDVSAAYLRKINIEDVDLNKYNIPLSEEEEIEFSKDEWREKKPTLKALKKGSHLAYQIYLSKPKDILVIDNEGKDWCSLFVKKGRVDTALLKALEDEGICCMHGMANAAYSQWLFNPSINYTYQLTLQLSPTNKCRNYHISQRIITKNMLIASANGYHQAKRPFTLRALFKSPDMLIEESWRCWILQKMAEHGVTAIEPKENFNRLVDADVDAGNVLMAVLDDHGDNFNETLANYNNDQTHFYQDSNHLNKDLAMLIHNPYVKGDRLKKGRALKVNFQFLDGILSNVLIYDERIQQFFDRKHPYTEGWGTQDAPSVGAVAQMSGIYCPPGWVLDMSRQTYPVDYEDHLAKYQLSLCERQTKVKGIHAVVIHIGVIEKMLKTEGLRKDRTAVAAYAERLEQKISWLFDKKPLVIITSGRGKPDNLPDNIPFLGYSILSQYVIENRFKSLLVDAVYAARPKI